VELKMVSNLEKMRKDAYLSQNKLAEITEVPRTAIRSIEEGTVKEISIEYIKKLCIFFKCKVDKIIDFIEIAV
jgi:DNA-binding Xre family transcriptional regulator